MPWITREIRSTLEALSRQKPVLLLTGCRQSGKTSLLERAFSDCGFVSLDLPATAEQADNSGEQFLATHPPPHIIDEVQYAPRLFRYLKHAVDRRRDVPGQYLLTGSQKFPLMAGVSESLAGRVVVLELHPLSLREIETARGDEIDRSQLLQLMFVGGYPELHAKHLEPQRFYSDYIATYLERDVRQALQVRSLRDFDRFLRLCAARSGQLLSMNSLASDVGVSSNTVRSWLSVLEASGIVMLLAPYYRNLGKRLVKTPKLYFLDTGLACSLLGVRRAADLAASALLGPMFETLVLGQIVRWFTNRGLSPNVYFYRDHYGVEVDFVIPVADRLKLIECKWSETPGIPKGFEQLQ
ncbi:MAG: ATP-binding protein, partial [Proteobacteria bacterium]|nr:ATP-binding protein [Pseudomonadota bacterium]